MTHSVVTVGRACLSQRAQRAEQVVWDSTGAMTATVAEVVCRELARGLSAEMAAQFAGLSYATFKDWLVDGRRLIRRTHLEPSFEPTDDEVELMEFCTEVSAALAGWVQRANGVLEQMMYTRRRVTTKTVYEITKDAETGQETLVATERHVTETEEPIDATPITWRLARVVPQIHSANPRYEQESDEGETDTIDIRARVLELMDWIAGTLTVVDDGTDEAATALAM